MENAKESSLDNSFVAKEMANTTVIQRKTGKTNLTHEEDMRYDPQEKQQALKRTLILVVLFCDGKMFRAYH